MFASVFVTLRLFNIMAAGADGEDKPDVITEGEKVESKSTSTDVEPEAVTRPSASGDYICVKCGNGKPSESTLEENNKCNCCCEDNNSGNGGCDGNGGGAIDPETPCACLDEHGNFDKDRKYKA